MHFIMKQATSLSRRWLHFNSSHQYIGFHRTKKFETTRLLDWKWSSPGTTTCKPYTDANIRYIFSGFGINQRISGPLKLSAGRYRSFETDTEFLIQNRYFRYTYFRPINHIQIQILVFFMGLALIDERQAAQSLALLNFWNRYKISNSKPIFSIYLFCGVSCLCCIYGMISGYFGNYMVRNQRNNPWPRPELM